MIVTLDDVKAHLKIETDDEDAFLQGLIDSVTDDVSNYCHEDYRSDSVDPYTVPAAVKLATKLLVAHYYENRDIQDHLNYRAAFTAYQFLLYPYRAPDKMF